VLAGARASGEPRALSVRRSARVGKPPRGRSGVVDEQVGLGLRAR